MIRGAVEALFAIPEAASLLAVCEWMAVGLIIGALSMMLGLGGGTLMVPTFRLLGRLSALVSSATSLFVVVPTGVAGVIRHLRAGTCRIPIGLAAGIGGALTSVAGAKLADIAPSWTIMAAASAVILYSAVTMFRSVLADGKAKANADASAPSPAPEEAPAEASSTRRQVVLAALIGVCAGAISGFVGVGGGFVMIPMFLSILHLDMHHAAGTSLLAVFCLATPAAIAQMAMGNVNYLVGIPVAIGSIVGTSVGKRISAHMSDRALKLVFSVLLAVAAVLLIVNEF